MKRLTIFILTMALFSGLVVVAQNTKIDENLGLKSGADPVKSALRGKAPAAPVRKVVR